MDVPSGCDSVGRTILIAATIPSFRPNSRVFGVACVLHFHGPRSADWRLRRTVLMRITRTFPLVLVATLVTGATHLAAQPQRGYARGRGDGPAFVMAGTFELEATRGDDPRRAADRATRDLPGAQRDRVYQSLMARLQPPRLLAIDRDRGGRTYTIASSIGPRASFEIDRREWHERGWRGRDITTHVEFVSDRLTIWTAGDRETDYSVTFESIDRGRGLLVTRRFDSEALRGPVTIRSYYRRIHDEPRWDIYVAVQVDDRRPDAGGRDVAVPRDAARIVAVLDTPLSTRTSRDGQHFSMTVHDRGEYDGARIDGTIERVETGRDQTPDMRIVFDRIHLRSGRDADIDAYLESVRTPNGASVRVDTSGTVQEPNRTTDTVEKGAVGAALGAVVGAVIGGGKGAAIGAAVGGAGGVIAAQTRSDVVDLPPGTQLTLMMNRVK